MKQLKLLARKSIIIKCQLWKNGFPNYDFVCHSIIFYILYFQNFNFTLKITVKSHLHLHKWQHTHSQDWHTTWTPEFQGTIKTCASKEILFPFKLSGTESVWALHLCRGGRGWRGTRTKVDCCKSARPWGSLLHKQRQ